jgi:hypothetical protein
MFSNHKFFAQQRFRIRVGLSAYTGIALADVDEVHRALVRVEQAITDLLLFVGVRRNVVPVPALGLLKGLERGRRVVAC